MTGTRSDARGLSPRGRGSPVDVAREQARDGSIPAWAGEPGSAVFGQPVGGVYPRVGGGARAQLGELHHGPGLSPRGRGSPALAGRGEGGLRSIPAWAGEPPWASSSKRLGRVYPRVGGGACRVGRTSIRRPGLSPRGRGSLMLPTAEGPGARSIPAWAGEPVEEPRGARRCPRHRVYPRVGGGAPGLYREYPRDFGLSPRGRGSP